MSCDIYFSGETFDDFDDFRLLVNNLIILWTKITNSFHLGGQDAGCRTIGFGSVSGSDVEWTIGKKCETLCKSKVKHQESLLGLHHHSVNITPHHMKFLMKIRRILLILESILYNFRQQAFLLMICMIFSYFSILDRQNSFCIYFFHIAWIILERF